MQYPMQPELADFDLPGVTPSRQKRSRETTAALLKAGAEMLRTRSLAELSIEALCAKVVLRAALQHDDTRPHRWTTFKSLARAATGHATPSLLRIMGRGREAAKTRAIAFGFQVVLGTLVNAILNDPGPLSVHDDEMQVRLSGCLLLLLEAEMKASPAVARGARRRKQQARQPPR
jgi:hypothetical protein